MVAKPLRRRIVEKSGTWFAYNGERLGQELGFDVSGVEINLDGVKASFGLDSSTDSLTYRDLQKRRELINKRMRDHARR